MTSIIIGIDPGFHGALAKFVGNRLVAIEDMPIIVTTKASKGSSIRDLIGGVSAHKSTVLDRQKLVLVLRKWSEGQDALVVREDVHTMPRQGIVSSSKLMRGVGELDMAATALGLRLLPVAPQTWKKATGCPTNKAEACRYAADKFPEFAHMFKRTSIDDGRAEAALIGLWGVQHG